MQAALRKQVGNTPLLVRGRKVARTHHLQPHLERNEPVHLCMELSHKPSSHGTGVMLAVNQECGHDSGKLITMSYINKAAETTYKLFK